MSFREPAWCRRKPTKQEYISPTICRQSRISPIQCDKIAIAGFYKIATALHLDEKKKNLESRNIKETNPMFADSKVFSHPDVESLCKTRFHFRARCITADFIKKIAHISIHISYTFNQGLSQLDIREKKPRNE